MMLLAVTLSAGLWQMYISWVALTAGLIGRNYWVYLSAACALMGARRLTAAYLLWREGVISMPPETMQVIDKMALPLVITALLGEFVRRATEPMRKGRTWTDRS